MSSAERWGPLWGARPEDWARSEDQQVPTYEEALRHVELAAGARVLDIGCGVGAFLRLVAARGARPYGIDASEALLALARARVPEADLRWGDMEALPYESDTFDLVTGFNALFFATDIVVALREAARVAKPGAPVVIQVWGPHEENELEAVKQIIRPFMPPRPPGAPIEPDYSQPGVLEALAQEAGLEPECTFDTTWAYGYADEDELGRALVAPAGIAAMVADEGAIRASIVEGLANHRTADGGYRLSNQFHALIARAAVWPSSPTSGITR